jgi:hypothetical protein
LEINRLGFCKKKKRGASIGVHSIGLVIKKEERKVLSLLPSCLQSGVKGWLSLLVVGVVAES